jgi:hypothetical protein
MGWRPSLIYYRPLRGLGLLIRTISVIRVWLLILILPFCGFATFAVKSSDFAFAF